jgi:hypothetical protein
VKIKAIQGLINSELGCNRVKHNKARDDEVRFGKIRPENEVRRGEIRKKQASEM